MTQTSIGPIAYTGDGQSIFPAQSVPAGQPQPLGVLADGRPVWPVAPGAGPAGKPQPLGVLPDGTFLFGPTGMQGVIASPSTTKPLWQKKRVLIPAGLLTLAVIVSATGGGDKTEITPSANSETTATAPQTTEKSAAELAAEKADADKAAADKAAADQAAADKAAADQAAADKAAAAAEAASKGPRAEQALLQAVVAGREAYEGTDNELKQRQAQQQRSAALRAAVPGLKATSWVGEIRTIDTNGEGKAVLELSLGDDTKLGTWNNALSDFQDNTLIPMDSAMYKTLINMEEGDRIRFSGTFFRDEEQGLEEKSLTFNGQMTTPNFVFRFSSISAI